MKISVIIPVYNVEKYINDCLQSVMEQTYNDFEVIVIDDGSYDNTRNIISSFKDSRISYFFQNNKGLSAARNQGIKFSKGDILFFMDSDDVIKSDLFEKCINFFKKKKCDVVFFGFQYFKEQRGEKKLGTYIYPEKKNSTMQSKEALERLFKGQLLHYSWMNMAVRDVYIENDLYFPDGRNYEDFSTTYKLIFYSDKVGMLADSYYLYRQRQDSIMHHVSKKEAKDILIAEREIIRFVNQNVRKEISLAYTYVLRRLIDAWVYASVVDDDPALSEELMQEVKTAYEHANRKGISKKTKLKYLLLKFGFLKTIYKLIRRIR